MELLRSIIGKNGKTLIVVTHDVRIMQFADRIVRLEDGRIVS
jgi:putative ABC transport system ATP-binding protein